MSLHVLTEVLNVVVHVSGRDRPAVSCASSPVSVSQISVSFSHSRQTEEQKEDRTYVNPAHLGKWQTSHEILQFGMTGRRDEVHI